MKDERSPSRSARSGHRHAFVLGSGIAGLSTAEILSRNGYAITLVESARELGGDASRCTQNWLHTGWLYAGLRDESAMLGCSHALSLFRRTYEPVLSPGIVNVEADEHGVFYPPSSVGWFSPERVHYLYALGSHELSRREGLAWRRQLEDVVLPRLRRLGYPTDAARELPRCLVELMNRWETDESGHERYRVIPSTDARIDTRRVLTSLLQLLGERTQVVTGARYSLEARGDRTAVRIDGELHTPDLVVMASGRGTPSLLQDLGRHDLAGRFKSISSPIVVLDRALDLPNFIRFTPRLTETVNHIKYAVDGTDLSTLGSHDSYPAGETPDIEPFVERVCHWLGVPRRHVLGSYYGTKTELTDEAPRRYNHATLRVNDNTMLALAGKLSQFPLLVNELASALGLRTDITNERRGRLDMEIASTAPERLARAFDRDAQRRAA